MKQFKNITLEMSFKPFKSNKQDYIEAVCKEVFDQWKELLNKTDLVSVLLWTSDGSEILEYKGDMEDTFEWAKYIGGANPRMGWNEEQDPNRINLHATYYLYTEEPPTFTYGQYKQIIETIKRIGFEITGKPIRVGATFDPGPEFAKSDFKYNRHNEICVGESMGKSSMVCCYALLQEDKNSYAGFPAGIPEGTPFGTFFGRQSQVFMEDMGFDYLWLSNGFGFGTETWGMIGATFDREHFQKEKMLPVQEKIMEFWKLFRQECNYRVETRGTNMTLGIDLASDAVNLKNIYEGGFDILPPCNSPWAAINGDYGIELAGYLSRMAELPLEEDYIYRFYVHDPWWMNSPWLDRYERQPHDIYLPLATARLDKKGNVSLPSYLSFLTIDNSLGDMPRQCPNEIIPQILDSMKTAPDGLAPLIWVYPFREYNEMFSGRASKPFFEDMFIRGAINHGLPLSMVVSTDNFIYSLGAEPEKYRGSVLVLPVPVKGEPINDHIISLIEHGHKVFLYGSIEEADCRLVEFLHLRQEKSLEGVMELSTVLISDTCCDGSYPKEIRVNKVLSDGGMNVVLDENSDSSCEVLAVVRKKDKERVVGIYRGLEEWKGGAVIWFRGSNGGEFTSGGANISDYNSTQVFPIESLARLSMQRFGIQIGYEKQVQESREPITMVSRNENAFYFSGYCPDTTVRMKLKFPLGAPLLLGSETYLEDGCSVYNHPRAWHKECRVFVEQEDGGIITCRDIAPCSFFMYRRIEVRGLKNAKVTILPRKGFEDETEVLVNPVGPFVVGETHKVDRAETDWGTVIRLDSVTGTIIISEKHVAYSDGKQMYP
jgi:hypothetical protein